MDHRAIALEKPSYFMQNEFLAHNLSLLARAPAMCRMKRGGILTTHWHFNLAFSFLESHCSPVV